MRRSRAGPSPSTRGRSRAGDGEHSRRFARHGSGKTVAIPRRGVPGPLGGPTLLIRASTWHSTGFSGERVHRIEDSAVEIELWAQDIGEPVLVDGAERFLVSKRMPPAMGPASMMSGDRKRVAEIVLGAESIVEAPFVFEGGNVAFDRGLALIGRNDVSRTLAASGENVSRKRVLEGPIAVVCRLEGGGLDAETRQLRHYSGQLQELGYRVSFPDHSASDLSAYRSSINVVPFYDRKRVLLPVFHGELADTARVVDRAALLGKAARAFDLYGDLAYASPLRDVTHPLAGDTHCIPERAFLISPSVRIARTPVTIQYICDPILKRRDRNPIIRSNDPKNGMFHSAALSP